MGAVRISVALLARWVRAAGLPGGSWGIPRGRAIFYDSGEVGALFGATGRFAVFLEAKKHLAIRASHI